MRLQISELLLDERNVKLLRLLRDDPRMGISEMARRVGMSAPAVRERVQRLEEAGVIRSYRLEIEPRAGEDCFILRVYLESLDDLDRILDRFLEVGQTTTSLLQSSPVPLRDLPLPGADPR